MATAPIRQPPPPTARSTTVPRPDLPGNAPQKSGEHPGLAGLHQLLASEEKVRAARDEIELSQLIVNETRRLIGARQVFLLRRITSNQFKVLSVSSLALVDRDTPLIRSIEAVVRSINKQSGGTDTVDFTLPAYAEHLTSELGSYPFTEIVWQPFKLDEALPFAGILAARDLPWRPDDTKLLIRQAGVYTSAWSALKGRPALQSKSRRSRWLGIGSAAVVALAGLIPVPMTTLAPVEIIAAEPEIVTAPIDGVIKDILVDPNRHVEAGSPLFIYDDTVLKNRSELAERDMTVAKTRFERAEQAALSDIKARHDLMISKTEYELKKAERDYAEALRAKTIVAAASSGILIYGSRDEWLGRPVATGEKIMTIARPRKLLARIELAVADAIALANGSDVRLFLDASPLDALRGRITNESYHAEPNSSNQLVYTLYATLDAATLDRASRTSATFPAKSTLPRIGARGTAQVFGTTVPLAFFLFRRPIAYVRQTFGF